MPLGDISSKEHVQSAPPLRPVERSFRARRADHVRPGASAIAQEPSAIAREPSAIAREPPAIATPTEVKAEASHAEPLVEKAQIKEEEGLKDVKFDDALQLLKKRLNTFHTRLNVNETDSLSLVY